MSANGKKKPTVKDLFMEGYRQLHFHLRYATPEKPMKSLMLTGATPEVGTTTIAVNLAHFLFWAQEMRILLVDCCFEDSKFNYIFNIDLAPGFSDILLQESDFEMGSYKILENGKANLTVIPRGTVPLSPSYVLSQERVMKFLKEVKDKYDFIIFDTPAVIGNSWILSLPLLVDCVLMVVKSGLTTKRSTRKTKALLSKAQSKMIGVVLNNVE